MFWFPDGCKPTKHIAFQASAEVVTWNWLVPWTTIRVPRRSSRLACRNCTRIWPISMQWLCDVGNPAWYVAVPLCFPLDSQALRIPVFASQQLEMTYSLQLRTFPFWWVSMWQFFYLCCSWDIATMSQVPFKACKAYEPPNLYRNGFYLHGEAPS